MYYMSERGCFLMMGTDNVFVQVPYERNSVLLSLRCGHHSNSESARPNKMITGRRQRLVLSFYNRQVSTFTVSSICLLWLSLSCFRIYIYDVLWWIVLSRLRSVWFLLLPRAVCVSPAVFVWLRAPGLPVQGALHRAIAASLPHGAHPRQPVALLVMSASDSWWVNMLCLQAGISSVVQCSFSGIYVIYLRSGHRFMCIVYFHTTTMRSFPIYCVYQVWSLWKGGNRCHWFLIIWNIYAQQARINRNGTQ